MSKDDAKRLGNTLFKVGWFTLMIGGLCLLGTLLFFSSLEGYPPMWMAFPLFIGLVLIFASIVVEEIGGVRKL